MYRIYLAGPITYSQDHGEMWREAVRQNVGDKADWVDPTEHMPYEEAKEKSPEFVVEHDKALISGSDALLVGMMRIPTVGTWREVEYAVETCDMPVAFWQNPSNKPAHTPSQRKEYSSWIHEAGEIHNSLKESLRYLEDQLEDRNE